METVATWSPTAKRKKFLYMADHQVWSLVLYLGGRRWDDPSLSTYTYVAVLRTSITEVDASCKVRGLVGKGMKLLVAE
jgi:hypothetical protein